MAVSSFTLRSHTEEGRGPCPTYFRACCNEAFRGRAPDGTTLGYDHPAYHLTIHLEHECPHDLDEIEWEDAIVVLISLVDRGADREICEWYVYWLPRCMALVPRRRRKKFLQGVYRAAIRNGWVDRVALTD